VYDWGNGAERVEQVTAAEVKDGDTMVTIAVVVGDKVTPYSKVLVSAKGLFCGDGGLDVVKFPYPLLKVPAKPKDRWEWEVAGAGKVVRTVVGAEEVEVPAGKFQAVRVEAEVPIGREATQKTTTWYAPEVGWVKMVTKFGDAEDVKVLKSFTPGK
jgi:hypothetical protein